MSETKWVKPLGFGVLGLLAIAFTVLKAFGLITWPWWQALFPLWLPRLRKSSWILSLAE